MNDEDVVAEYRDALYEVKSYLMGYGLSTITGNHVRNAARKLDKLHQKKHTRGGLESAVGTAMEVDAIVSNLFSGEKEYPMLWRDPDLKLTLQAESIRLRTIPLLGCRGLFERFEEDGVRQEFKRGRRAGRNNTLELSYRKIIDELDKSSLPGMEGTQFIASVRAADTYRPVEIRESYAFSLVNCYHDLATGEKYAPMYLDRLARVMQSVDALAGALSLDVMQDRSLPGMSISEYADWVDNELELLEDIYVELVFLRLQSMV